MEKITMPESDQISILGAAAAREIVKEIMDFGVTQKQLLQIINLLALELEDNNVMRSLVDLCTEHKKKEKLHV
tara:strand:+ start:21700 stop:21918 length:219 start_codon:yes stop_codon:yes gene_type:complete